MPGELVTLKPTGGAELIVSSAPYGLGLDTDWGEHVIEPSLATGPDVIGGVVGTRERTTAEVTLPIRVSEDTAAAYIDAAETLSAAATALATSGGTIARQVDFGGGNLSEELECEVLACNIDADDGWFQAHRLDAVITLNITRNPAWLSEEEENASDATFTDSVKRLPLGARRGNLPGPGRIVLEDNDSTARRFVEIGGAFTQEPQQVEYLADDFTLGAATLETDADAIGGEALEVTPVLPVWTTVGILEGLVHAGGFTVRLRTKGGEDDSQFTSRVVWRAGSGPWQDLEERVETPDATNYYDLPAGVIRHFDSSETIDVRVDVRATASSSETYSLNGLTLTPNELYTIARGLPVEVPSVGVDAFDGFQTLSAGRSLDDSDGSGTNRIAPAGGTWLEAGSGAAVEFADYALGIRRKSANDSTSNIGTGYYAYLSDGTGATTYDDVDCTVTGSVNHNGVVNTETWLGALVRFVDANNWLMAALRHRRKNDGKYALYVVLYKRVAGTITKLEQVAVPGLRAGSDIAVHVTVTAAGAYELSAGWAGRHPDFGITGSDASLAPAAALDDGKVGIYSLVQSARDDAYSHALSIAAYGSANASLYTDVIREDGIGVFNSSHSYAADADGGDPQDFTPQGSRIWIPPGTAGEITAKVRSSDSENAPDVGAGDDTAITVYHRPAWANLSDALDPDAGMAELLIT